MSIKDMRYIIKDNKNMLTLPYPYCTENSLSFILLLNFHAAKANMAEPCYDGLKDSSLAKQEERVTGAESCYYGSKDSSLAKQEEMVTSAKVLEPGYEFMICAINSHCLVECYGMPLDIFCA
jgi:hypothetical protein